VTIGFGQDADPQLLSHGGTSFSDAVPALVAVPPPPPPPPPSTSAPSPPWAEGAVRVGGAVKPPVKVKHVTPVYPPEAQESGVQGVVIIEARIEPDGRISNARILRSVPLLDQAALDAAMQWEFEPSLLNGNAVPVLMTITVQFTLT